MQAKAKKGGKSHPTKVRDLTARKGSDAKGGTKRSQSWYEALAKAMAEQAGNL